ncbi:MAG: PH domain-containing protein, partial [Phycisphaerales bacterium]
RRFQVTGRDATTGKVSTVILQASSLAETERLAEELGLEVDSVELLREGGSPDPHAASEPLGTASPEGAPAAPRSTAASSSDELLWSGSPSQWLNFWWFLAFLVVFGCYLAIALATVGVGWMASPLLLAPFAAIAWKWLVLKLVRYELTQERIRVRSGVFTRHLEEIEIYRVKDTELSIPLWQRIVGIGTLRVISSDHTNPNIPLRGIADPESVRERIRAACEAVRRARGVRELDVS